MTWAFQPAAEAFEAVRKDWDALNRSQGHHLLLDSNFISPLLRHFGDRNIMLGIENDSARPGMMLLVKRGAGFWETFQPSQAPLGMILLGTRDETGEALQEITRQLPGFSLQFSVLQQDPDYSSFPAGLHRAEIETMEYIQTARVPISGTFEEYWRRRGTNLRHNLARQRRRLAEKGRKLEFVAHRNSDAVAACIGEFGRLESQGWKAGEGTAISAENVQGVFYRELFEAFCAAGEGVIYQFLIDGKVVASDLCLERGGMMVVLKTAYDEAWSEFSPALLLLQEIMQRLFAGNQIRVVEFYGRLRQWHTKWSDDVRTMYHVTCFRHRWVPGVKKLVKRLR